MDEIYLDNAASTPIDPRVLDVLIEASKTIFGNPSNIKHQHGRIAKQALDKARYDIGNFLDLDSRGIIFTSGATEANNLALRGLTCLQDKNCAVIVSQIEHSCIDESLKFLIKRGVNIKAIPTQPNGIINLQALDSLVKTTPNLRLVSIMLVNNETGVIQPFAEISKIVKSSGALLHTDAVQAVGKMNLAILKNADMISLSAHKINGPKGVGCLWIRPDLFISPLLVGGGQESGIRSGTTPVPNIMAFAKAVEIAVKDMAWINNLTPSMRILERSISSLVPNCVINGFNAPRIPTIINISFPFKTSVIDLIKGVAVSSGAACSCNLPRPSKVLVAMGLPEILAKNCLRISSGRTNTISDIVLTQNLLGQAIRTAQFSG